MATVYCPFKSSRCCQRRGSHTRLILSRVTTLHVHHKTTLMLWRYSTKRHFGIIVCVIVRSSSKENCILACCFVRTHDISASLSVCHSQDIHRQRVHFGIHVCCSFYRERELDTGARLSVGRVCVCVCVCQEDIHRQRVLYCLIAHEWFKSICMNKSGIM